MERTAVACSSANTMQVSQNPICKSVKALSSDFLEMHTKSLSLISLINGRMGTFFNLFSLIKYIKIGW